MFFIHGAITSRNADGISQPFFILLMVFVFATFVFQMLTNITIGFTCHLIA